MGEGSSRRLPRRDDDERLFRHGSRDRQSTSSVDDKQSPRRGQDDGGTEGGAKHDTRSLKRDHNSRRHRDDSQDDPRSRSRYGRGGSSERKHNIQGERDTRHRRRSRSRSRSGSVSVRRRRDPRSGDADRDAESDSSARSQDVIPEKKGRSRHSEKRPRPRSRTRSSSRSRSRSRSRTQAKYKSKGRSVRSRSNSTSDDGSESDSTDSDSGSGSSSSGRESSSRDNRRRKRHKADEKTRKARNKRDDRKKRHKKHKKHKKHKSEKKSGKHKKDKKKKGRKQKHNSGNVSDRSYGKYGIIRDSDMWSKQPELLAYVQEVKGLDPDVVSRGDLRGHYEDYMESFNTATLPHKKYYDLEKWTNAKVAKGDAGKDGAIAAMLHSDPFAFNDEELLRQERKKALADAKSVIDRKELLAMSQVMRERVEEDYKKRLGMETNENRGVRYQ